jgi:hypothetical protein
MLYNQTGQLPNVAQTQSSPTFAQSVHIRDPFLVKVKQTHTIQAAQTKSVASALFRGLPPLAMG